MQRCLPALRQMGLHGKSVRVGLIVCCFVRWHCHERSVGVLNVPFVECELAEVRLAIGERTCGCGNGGAALDTREGNLDIAVACHANGNAAVKVVRVEKRRLVHVTFRKRRDLKDGRAFVIGSGGERDGRILAGDVDHDHTEHGARENEHPEGVFFVGMGFGGRERQYEGVCAFRHARQHNAR